MKKTLLASFLISSLLTSTVSWSYRPDWSYTIPGIIVALRQTVTIFQLSQHYQHCKAQHSGVTTPWQFASHHRGFLAGTLIDIGVASYLLCKGFVANRVPLQKEAE